MKKLLLILLCLPMIGFAQDSENEEIAKIFFNRGNANGNLGQYRLAIKDFTEAISYQNGFTEAYFKRGVAYAKLKKYDLAIDDYNLAILFKPNHWDAIFNSGLANKKIKNYSIAIELFTKILLNAPWDKELYAESYFNRGNTFAAMNQIPDAIDDYNSSIKIDKNYALPYANRGYLKSINGISYCEDFKKACELGDKKACKWYIEDKCDK